MTIQSINQYHAAKAAGKKWPGSLMKAWGAGAATAARFYSLFQNSGIPAAGSYTGTALNAQAPTDATTGALWHGGNVTPDIKSLDFMELVSGIATYVPATFWLVDLQLYYPGINANATGAQTLVNGVSNPRNATGDNCMVWAEVTTALGATPANIALSYTDQSNNAANALGATVAAQASQIAQGLISSTFGPWLPLAAGDRGVRSVQSVTMSAAMGAGAFSLCVGEVLARGTIGAAGLASGRNFWDMVPTRPDIKDGACLVLLCQPGAAVAAGSILNGELDFVWG
jgi:hypothetical protein